MTRTAYELSDWQGYLTRVEIDLLKEVSKTLQPNPLIVNIGAGAGTSTLAFLEARSDALVFSIDVLTNEREVTTNEHLRLAEIDAKDAMRVIRVWGDSKKVGRAWRWQCDLVFVDGDHEEAGIRGDLAVWKQHVKVDGWMCFHDYGSPKWPHVKEVIAADQDLAYWAERRLSDTILAVRRSNGNSY